MSVEAKPLINAKYAAATNNTEYTTPNSKKTIIDKFTATNTDSSTRTITVNIVPNGTVLDNSSIITSAMSLTAGQSAELPELKNQILAEGDFISVFASVGSKVVIRASGREVL